MRWQLALAIWLIFALPVAGQGAYLDDRSSPEAVLRSLYNAINLQDYARAWSYFDPDHAPSFSAYVRGFDDTAEVLLRTEPPQSLSSESGRRWQVPVTLVARQSDGSIVVFSGCYQLIQADQRRRPPYQPIGIVAGHFHLHDGPAETAQGNCDW